MVGMRNQRKILIRRLNIGMISVSNSARNSQVKLLRLNTLPEAADDFIYTCHMNGYPVAAAILLDHGLKELVVQN